jgi:CspA family cold shock protein
MLEPLGSALRSASVSGSGGVTRPSSIFQGGLQLISLSAGMAKLPAANVRSAGTRGRVTAEHDGGGVFPMAMTGTVKFFNGERGYGFIKPDDGGRDVFVHITAVERAGLKDLAEGQRITFEVEPDKKGKGPKAVNLVVSS